MADSGFVHSPSVNIIYVQLDKCFKQFKIKKDGESNSRLQAILSAVYDINDKDVAKINDPMLNEIRAELKKLAKNKEVQLAMLAEKYAIADWNTAMMMSEAKGEAKGEAIGEAKARAEILEKLTNNIIEREGISREEAVLKAKTWQKVRV